MSEASSDSGTPEEKSSQKKSSTQSTAEESATEKTSPRVADVLEDYAQRSGIQRKANGQVDLMSAVGGWQGIAETAVPGLIFLVLYTVTQELPISLIAAVGSAAIFTVIRLVQGASVRQALAGLVGVGICAWFAQSTGKAEDYYVGGFIINVISIAVLLVSVLARWPITGVLFGFLRGEGMEWRKNPERRRAYNVGAWIMIGVFVFRLVVQYPLYLAGNVTALGVTRLVMGVPLYALGVWLAWMISRPVGNSAEGSAEAEHESDTQESDSTGSSGPKSSEGGTSATKS